jgi:SnoaL-like domain
MTNLELDEQLNDMIIHGKSVEAFEKFYDEGVVAQENDEPERHGRDAWMRARQEMEKAIKTFDAHVKAHAANGDVTFSEWEYNIELAGAGVMKIVQCSVRRWKDGRIIRERFYHK